jgi:hypothetical protein
MGLHRPRWASGARALCLDGALSGGVRARARRKWLDQEYQRLRFDAQASAGNMSRSPRLQSPDEWEGVVLKAAEDYRSGMGLIDQLGASGLLDPAMVGMLIAIRRSLFEETNASSARELVLIDMGWLPTRTRCGFKR